VKQFIVMIAILPILLSFAIQLDHSQINNHKNLAVERAIETAEMDIKLDGCLTSGTKDVLAKNIASIMGVGEDEVVIEGPSETQKKYKSSGTKYEDSKIVYSIKYKFNDVMAANALYGIRDEDNSVDITINRKVLSEKLRV